MRSQNADNSEDDIDDDDDNNVTIMMVEVLCTIYYQRDHRSRGQ